MGNQGFRRTRKLCRAQQISITRSRTPTFHRRIRSLSRVGTVDPEGMACPPPQTVLAPFSAYGSPSLIVFQRRTSLTVSIRMTFFSAWNPRTVSLPLSVRLSHMLPRLIPWLIQIALAAQPITGKRWGRVGTGLPRGQERVPPSERNRRLSPYCALHFPVGTFPGRELSSMKLI